MEKLINRLLFAVQSRVVGRSEIRLLARVLADPKYQDNWEVSVNDKTYTIQSHDCMLQLWDSNLTGSRHFYRLCIQDNTIPCSLYEDEILSYAGNKLINDRIKSGQLILERIPEADDSSSLSILSKRLADMKEIDS